jgi:8-oxo-dGTP pyrophosphatase MutT (NUDIX family)
VVQEVPLTHDGGWKRHSSRYLFESNWYRLRQDEVELPNGQPKTYTLVEHTGYALVVPLLDDGRVLLERVYRYAVQDTLLECPSGGLDGEPADTAARRELEEETGWLATTLTPLGSFYASNGMSNERGHFYLARGLRETGVLQRDATEQIELEFIPFADAIDLVFAGAITDGPSALGLLLAERQLRGG